MVKGESLNASMQGIRLLPLCRIELKKQIPSIQSSRGSALHGGLFRVVAHAVLASLLKYRAGDLICALNRTFGITPLIAALRAPLANYLLLFDTLLNLSQYTRHQLDKPFSRAPHMLSSDCTRLNLAKFVVLFLTVGHR